MTIKIDSPIVSVDVVNNTDLVEHVQDLNEKVKRPKLLSGATYQLKTPLSEFTWYITINNIILNEGTVHEKVQPFEIFINTKDVASYQWMIFASRMLSAIFRKGGDINFILDEMASVHQPNGGYLGRGGYIPSLVAEIGKIIEYHFKSIGLVKDETDTTIKDFIEEKIKNMSPEEKNFDICPKCGARAYVKLEGCGYCTECYESKCG